MITSHHICSRQRSGQFRVICKEFRACRQQFFQSRSACLEECKRPIGQVGCFSDILVALGISLQAASVLSNALCPRRLWGRQGESLLMRRDSTQTTFEDVSIDQERYCSAIKTSANSQPAHFVWADRGENCVNRACCARRAQACFFPRLR